jgi:hypothetical protein
MTQEELCEHHFDSCRQSAKYAKYAKSAGTAVPEGVLQEHFYYEAALQLAYEAGRWQGPVDLEEHYDREQYSQVLPEVFASRRTSSPGDFASTGRTVRVNLRSDEWREGVRRSVQEYLNKARSAIANAGGRAA